MIDFLADFYYLNKIFDRHVSNDLARLTLVGGKGASRLVEKKVQIKPFLFFFLVIFLAQ